MVKLLDTAAFEVSMTKSFVVSKHTSAYVLLYGPPNVKGFSWDSPQGIPAAIMHQHEHSVTMFSEIWMYGMHIWYTMVAMPKHHMSPALVFSNSSC